MASRNQRERRAPERYGVISIGILFDGENSDLELEEEEEEIELAGEVGSSTNPVYNSSEEEVEEPRRKRRRRGRENTESSSVRERSDSSESDGTDTNSISNLFAEDSSNGAFEGFPNCSLQWQEPVGEINPPTSMWRANRSKSRTTRGSISRGFFSTVFPHGLPWVHCPWNQQVRWTKPS